MTLSALIAVTARRNAAKSLNKTSATTVSRPHRARVTNAGVGRDWKNPAHSKKINAARTARKTSRSAFAEKRRITHRSMAMAAGTRKIRATTQMIRTEPSTPCAVKYVG